MNARPYTQFSLFEDVAGAYNQPESGRLTNAELYRIAAGRAGVSREALEAKTPIGKAGAMRSVLKQELKWRQQTLRRMGIIERVDGERGVWELTEAGKSKLRKVKSDVAVLAFSTDLGLALWSNCTRAFEQWDEPIFGIISSPPFPLRQPRAYGGPTETQYTDFISHALEPLVRNLAPGGSVVLQLGDVFMPGSPAKSTYIEELVLELPRRLGLHFMNRITWSSNKPPGPIQWSSIRRTQLVDGAEYCLWFSNDPNNCFADNRRILEPHTETHKKLIARGGENRTSVNGDGAYRLKPGSYRNQTEGRIPRTVWNISNTCSSQRAYKARARELGLQPHGATMPLELARKLVRFLTEVGQLVAEPFAGSQTTPLACELEGRPWVSCDTVFDYVRGGAERFVDRPGFELHLQSL